MSDDPRESDRKAPPELSRPGAVSVSAPAPRGKPTGSSRQVASTVAITGAVESMGSHHPLEPGQVESESTVSAVHTDHVLSAKNDQEEEDEDIAKFSNSTNILAMEPEDLVGPCTEKSITKSNSVPPAVETAATVESAAARARANRRGDAKAVIREEMNALRSQGQYSQGPGAVTITGSVAAGTAHVAAAVSADGDSRVAGTPTTTMASSNRRNSKAAIKQEMEALRGNEEMNRPGAHSVARTASSGKGGGARAERPGRRTLKNATSSSSTLTDTSAPSETPVNANPSKPGAAPSTVVEKEKAKADHAGTPTGTPTGNGSSKVGAVSATGSDGKEKVMKLGDASAVSSGSTKNLMKTDLKASGSPADFGLAAVADAGGMKSAKDNDKNAPTISEQPLSFHDAGEDGMVSAQVIDEEELEAQYNAKIMQNVVAAEVVDEAEFKETGRCWKMTCCCIFIIAIICAIAIPLSKEQEIPTDAPTASPTEQDEYDYLYDLVSDFSGKALDDNSTAQYRALQWLAFEDPAGLPIKETNQTLMIERYGAAVIYYSMNGEQWTRDFNFMSNRSVCDWNEGINGLTCHPTNDTVKQLWIDENNVAGTLPSEFLAFSRLNAISLYGGSLQGTIPSEFGDLNALTYLQIGEHQLTGTIPPSLGLLDLDVFNLYMNQLSGTIPGDIFKGKDNLHFLGLDVNRFEGPLPDLDRQSAITYAFFDQNKFEGTIPQSYMEQESFQILSLTDNLLTGTIPEQIRGLRNLQALYAHKNRFSGTIPATFSELRDLSEILLNDNNFEGTIPSELGQVEILASLDVSGNQLTGSLPSELGNIATLVTLDVSSNSISGTVPLSFSQLSLLTSFKLSNTSITDGLSAAFCEQSFVWTSIQADCGGGGGEGNATVPCDCCTTCCVNGEACEINLLAVCEARSSEFEMVVNRGTNCDCLDGGLKMSCNDTACETCNLDESICALSTDYGYGLNETTGERISFHNTIKYTKGRNETLLYVKNAVDESKCHVYVNGEECQECTVSLCKSSNEGYSIDCSNLEGGFELETCDPKVDAGYLEVFWLSDVSLLSGCAPMIINYEAGA